MDRGKQVVLVANPLYWRGAKARRDRLQDRSNRDACSRRFEHTKWTCGISSAGAYLRSYRSRRRLHRLQAAELRVQPYRFQRHACVVADRRAASVALALDRPGILETWRTASRGAGHRHAVEAPYYVDMGRRRTIRQGNALLDQAGWRRGPDGVRAKNGTKLTLNFAVVSGRPIRTGSCRSLPRIGSASACRSGAPLFAVALFASGPKGVIDGNAWDAITLRGPPSMGDYSGNYGCDAFPPAGGTTYAGATRRRKLQ